jgi:hypothetical protein
MKSACWLLVYEDSIQRVFRFGAWHICYKLSDGAVTWL